MTCCPSHLGVQDLLQDSIWSLPAAMDGALTNTPEASNEVVPLLDSSLAQQRLTTQQRGCNAMLLKAALECCGTAARALGSRFAQNGHLLRAVLLPMFEKLGKHNAWLQGYVLTGLLPLSSCCVCLARH